MGRQVNASTKPEPTGREGPKPARAVPEALAELALVDAHDCADARRCSVSTWLDDVREGRAPPPVIRRPRYTRWRLGDLKKHLIEIASQQSPEVAQAVVSKAQEASKKAQVMRRIRARAAQAGR
jgi:hypothetical protein